MSDRRSDASRQVAALFVETGGCYFGVDGVDPWDERRDARLYVGDDPIVAHPPCNLWVNLAAVNWKRYGRRLPAWYPGGDDGGCFLHAIQTARRVGGVIEHPAYSWAWRRHGLTRPPPAGGWVPSGSAGWTCEIWQSAYGHRARKRTWLLYAGRRLPTDMCWDHPDATHQIGKFDRRLPTLEGRAASRTPIRLRDALIDLARRSR